MAVSDLFDMLDTFIPTDDGDDDDSGNRRSSSKDVRLSFWKRANLGVKVLVREQRKTEATRCVLAFFRDFEDLEALEEVVKEIEDLVTRPIEAQALEEQSSS